MDQGMTRKALLAELNSTEINEGAQSRKLRKYAFQIIDSSSLTGPEVCLGLLTNIVKPLFSTTKHAALTSSGRKNLVPPPPSAGRFSNGFEWDESKPWKNGWTIDVLIFILTSYNAMEVTMRKATLEEQFYLLIPPTLNTIDDSEIQYKTDGCHLLRLLCQTISSSNSDILRRAGLMDVFVGALKANFMLLPSLTPEDDSLALLNELYPAFLALIDASYQNLTPKKPSSGSNSMGEPHLHLSQLDLNSIATPALSGQKQPSNSILETADRDDRQSLLDLIMRHGILASYNHVLENIKISTFLLTQASVIVSDMGVYAAKYLQNLLPLLRNVLSNPFGTAAPELLLSALGLVKSLIEVCWPRIQERWWTDCLRGCVDCWLVVCDDKGVDKEERLRQVERRLQELIALLNGVVGEEFSAAATRLLKKEEGLIGLFALVPDSAAVG